MSLARYFVFPIRGSWLVALEGSLIARHENRDAAVTSAIVMADLMGAMRHEADVLVEENGQLDIAWTYGVDPLPPSGMAASA